MKEEGKHETREDGKERTRWIGKSKRGQGMRFQEGDL